MAESRVYIRTRRETDAGSYAEVRVVEPGAVEFTILVADKKLVPKVKHLDLYRRAEDGTFIRQPFQIIKRKKTREGLLLELSRIGATKSAEMRRCTRVAAQAIRARLGDEGDCEVLDISDVGFAVVSGQEFEVGANVSVVLHHEGEAYPGQATVMSVRESEPGTFRYGMSCNGVASGNPGVLKKALPRITMQLQLMPTPSDD